MNNNLVIRSGIMGVVVGDALGVPVEFSPRADLKASPVTGMREYGTHHQPKGTWSDDSSMMLATMDSMIQKNGLDYADIMDRFNRWLLYGDYTPYGSTFDSGITSARAIKKYKPGRIEPAECGGDGERDNGNGSLMRIMPASLYSIFRFQKWDDPDELAQAINVIHNISALTHRHPRSLMGCGIYTFICRELIYNDKINEAVAKGVEAAHRFYTTQCPDEYAKEWDHYKRLEDISGFASLPEEAIRSSGYVVDTLEAAVWCLLNTGSFSECVLKAVNLGDDTDTVGAVAGGLAGLWYGYAGIPKEWLDVIARREWIEGMCADFSESGLWE